MSGRKATQGHLYSSVPLEAETALGLDELPSPPGTSAKRASLTQGSEGIQSPHSEERCLQCRNTDLCGAPVHVL